MEELKQLLDLARNHPAAAAGAAIGLVVLYYLLNRKPKLERQAEEQLRRLRQEKKGKYDQLRPL